MKKLFETKVIGTHDREVDSEYKLFELANLQITDNDEHELFMLSEMQLCESCKGVMEQFMLRHPNVKVSVVSTKESRMKRKYKGIDKEREGYRDRWKKK